MKLWVNVFLHPYNKNAVRLGSRTFNTRAEAVDNLKVPQVQRRMYIDTVEITVDTQNFLTVQKGGMVKPQPFVRPQYHWNNPNQPH